MSQDIAEESLFQKLNMTDETRERLIEIATEEAENLFEGAEGLWVHKDELPKDPSDLSKEEYERFLPRSGWKKLTLDNKLLKTIPRTTRGAVGEVARFVHRCRSDDRILFCGSGRR